MKADVNGRNRTLNGRTPSNGYFPPTLYVSHPRTHSPPPLMIPHPRRYFHLHALIHIHFRRTSLPTSFRNVGSDNNNRWPPSPSPPPPLSLFRYRFSSPSISPGRDFLGRPDEKECARARAIEVITRLQEARVSGRRGPREYLRER